ncbi:MAG TPA: DMT family transporter [Bacteroidia bacterium]|nr:DMT family transporter [Bacteroidia bacterium]
MNRNVKTHLALAAVNIFYGANYSIAKISLPAYIEPAGYILLRVSASALLYALAWYFVFRKEKNKIERGDWMPLAWCAFTGVAVNQLLFFKGLAITSPVNASLIITSNPVLVIAVAYFVLSEKITWRKSLGILSGISGAVFLILAENKNSSVESSRLGDSFILMNSFCYAIYLVRIKPLMKKYHPLQIVMIVFTMGALMMLPFGTHELGQVQWETFSGKIWFSVLYVIIAATFLAYLLNIYALKYVSPAVVSYYIYLQPLIAALIAFFYYHQPLHFIDLVSALLIFSGVYLVSTSAEVREEK